MNLKYNIFGFSALLISIVSLVLSFTKNQPKVGYAETSIILEKYSEAIKARKKIEEHHSKWKADIKKLNDSLIASMDNMKANYDQASPQEKKRMRKKLEKWDGDLFRYKKEVEKKVAIKKEEVMDPIINQINDYLKQWGQQKGFNMIFGTTASGNILQADEAYNITTEFLKDLNVHYKSLPDEENTIEQSNIISHKQLQVSRAEQSGNIPRSPKSK